MKTTIVLPDDLFTAVKRRAAEQGITVKTFIEAAVRRSLDERVGGPTPFRLRDCAVDGEGMSPEYSTGDWSEIRSAIYEGRGG